MTRGSKEPVTERAALGLFGPGIFGTGIDLSALDADTAYQLGMFFGEQIKAAEVRALRQAASELFTMTVDPFDLLTESVGIKGPLAVAVWLQDRADAAEQKGAGT